MLERISQTLAQQQLTKNRSDKQNGTPREKGERIIRWKWGSRGETDRK